MPRRIFPGPGNATPCADDDGGLELAGLRATHHGFVDTPVDSGVCDTRIEQVLPVVHIDDAVTAFRVVVVARRQPDLDMPRLLEERGLDVGPVDQRSQDAGILPVGHVDPGIFLEGRDCVPYRFACRSGQRVVRHCPPGRMYGFALPAAQREFVFEYLAVRYLDGRRAFDACAVHRQCVRDPGPQFLCVARQVDGRRAVRDDDPDFDHHRIRRLATPDKRACDQGSHNGSSGS